MARPRNPILSRDRIVAAALELVDETGRFTLPLLAKRLGVSMSSIYHHLANRAEIVEGIRELLSRDFPALDPGRRWPEEVRRWMRAYREIMVAHPHLIVEFSAHPLINETTRRAYEDLAGVLEHAGFPPESILARDHRAGQLRLRQRAGADRAGADVGLLRRRATSPSAGRPARRAVAARTADSPASALELGLDAPAAGRSAARRQPGPAGNTSAAGAELPHRRPRSRSSPAPAFAVPA